MSLHSSAFLTSFTLKNVKSLAFAKKRIYNHFLCQLCPSSSFNASPIHLSHLHPFSYFEDCLTLNKVCLNLIPKSNSTSKNRFVQKYPNDKWTSNRVNRLDSHCLLFFLEENFSVTFSFNYYISFLHRKEWGSKIFRVKSGQGVKRSIKDIWKNGQ